MAQAQIPNQCQSNRTSPSLQLYRQETPNWGNVECQKSLKLVLKWEIHNLVSMNKWEIHNLVSMNKWEIHNLSMNKWEIHNLENINKMEIHNFVSMNKWEIHNLVSMNK